MVLLMFRDEVFREYLLPNEDNIDYPVRLNKEHFHFGNDVVLQLEVVAQQWSLLADREYTFTVNERPAAGCELHNGDLLRFRTTIGEEFQAIVVEAGLTLRPYKKYDVSGRGTITIGKGPGNMLCYGFMDFVSKNHAAILVGAEGIVVQDYSTNGVFVNGSRIRQEYRPRFGEMVNIFGLHIIFLGSVIGVDTRFGTLTVNEGLLQPAVLVGTPPHGQPAGANPVFYNRSPRNVPAIHEDTLTIDPVPERRVSAKKPLLMTIGPAFTMVIPMLAGFTAAMLSRGSSGGAFMYTGLITAGASAVIGVMWALVNMRYAKKTEAAEEKNRISTYTAYLGGLTDQLQQIYEQNTAALLETYPDAARCSNYRSHNAELWNRNITHDDFLFHRLGIGDLPFQVQINIPKPKFTLHEDPLSDHPLQIQENFRLLRNVPVGINLFEKRLVGVVGGKNKQGAQPVIHNLIAQIAANNCYTDVKMAFVFTSEMARADWEFVRWLPHCWSQDKSTRYVAMNELEAADVFYELANIMRLRAENASGSTKGAIPRPQYLLFLFDAGLLDGELLAKYVFDPKEEYGLTTIIVADEYISLPNACEDIIQNDSSFQGCYNAMDSHSRRLPIQFDAVGIDALRRLAIASANIQVKELESNNDIPASLSFLDMYGVSTLQELRVAERWRKNRTFNSMRVPIGKKAGDVDCCLDIHEKYHGPHGLIAGTTGSGKSETLQTYIISLAINYSPDDIAFLIIDFKGGGMANLFSDLPHLAGQISNLSGNQVRRAMISIKSENLRRQRVFGEHNVNSINQYTRLFKNGEAAQPVPHLFIIIDEFAELKREEPDFMRELISVAQVGRSLGVHLILATQKPSGTVDDNIWSNSKFRLCLRVQDRQDSNDMLHKPDAAYLTQAGRCYLQVGNDEIYELFQSGWSGAVYDESATGAAAIATMLTNTGKTAIVGSRTIRTRKEHAKLGWYSQVAHIILQTAQGADITALDSRGIEELAAAAAEPLQRSGHLPAPGAADMLRLQELIRLWPPNTSSPEEIARSILARAAGENISILEMKEVTQLDAVVAYLNQLVAESGPKNNLQLWLPLLPTSLCLQQLPGFGDYGFDGTAWRAPQGEWTLATEVGLCDDPVNQAQLPLTYNFAQDGHLALCGGVVSGKSTFMQTLIFSLAQHYSPAQLNFYALDFSSNMLAPFEPLPHMGGVMYEHDEEKVKRFFHMIDSMMDERKKQFGGGNYSQYIRAYGATLPAIVIVIDGFANFKEKTDNRYEECLIRISREGVGYGIFLAVAAAGFGLAEIQSRIADNLRTVICLEMADKFKYMDTLRTFQLATLPESGVQGRGLAAVNGNFLEFQTALMCAADDDYERANSAKAMCEAMADAWQGPTARPVPEIPEEPVLSLLAELEEYRQKAALPAKLPFGYNHNDASVCCVELPATYFYAITGKARTGKTNLLKVLLHSAAQKENGQLCIIEMGSEKLRTTAEGYGAGHLSTGQQLFAYFEKLVATFKERNQLKHTLSARDIDDAEIFAGMQQQPPIFIFIDDMLAFLKMLYQPPEGVGAMSGFLENISEKGMLHNIFFFGCIDTEDSAELTQWRTYRNFTGFKTGVLLGGNVAAQRIFTFNNIPYMEAGKSMPKGLALTPAQEDETIAQKVVIPLAGR